jgi:hypothetical protein
LIIGSPQARLGSGTVHVVLGTRNLPDTLDLTWTDAYLMVQGPPGSGLGASLAAGDLDGDGKPELVAGAPDASPGERERAGEIFVFDQDNFRRHLHLSVDAPALRVLGARPGDGIGRALALSDLCANGRADLIIGAPSADLLDRTRAGAVLLVFGSSSFPSVLDLSQVPPDVTIPGEARDEQLGTGLATADLDGDRSADLIVASSLSSYRSRGHCGRVFVLPGGKRLNLLRSRLPSN